MPGTKVIAFHQVVLIEGVDGFGRLSLQMGGSSDHSFDEQQLGQIDQLEQLDQLEQIEQLQQLQLQIEDEGDSGEDEEDGSEILGSFLDTLEEENRR